MSAKVSIIIPVYKTEATLPRCIDSALAQTYSNIEIVIVDDGSPDRAGEIADQYAAKHANIVVVHKKNGGLAEARKSGIAAASGEFFVPLDSDDTIPENAVELLYNHCAEDDLDMCYGAYMRVVGDKRTIEPHHFTGVVSGDEFLKKNLELGFLCGSHNCICRTSTWTDDVFPPADKRFPSEDVLINVKLSKNLRRVGIFNDYVYDYYFYENSLSVGGAFFTLALWSDFFDEVRRFLHEQRRESEALEHLVRIMEIDRLAFYIKNYDKQHPWYKKVMSYSTRTYPRKTRVLHALLHCPPLLRWCIKMNRKRKSL